MTYLVGSRHEGLRRDRHGPPAGAHGVQGHAEASRHATGPDASTAPGSTARTWFDRTNYFETMPATDENLEWALELEADRMVNTFIAKEGPRLGNDGRPQRVRDGREQPDGVLIKRMMAAAYEWHNYGKSTIGTRVRHRERADREAAGVLQEVLPAGQRRADRRGQVRRGEGAGADRGEISARFRGRSASWSRPTPRSRRRTASAA